MVERNGRRNARSLLAGGYESARDLIGFDLGEQVALVGHMLRWVLLGSLVGVLGGVSSAVFLTALAWATESFDEHAWLLYLLPLGGLAIGLAYHYGGGRSVEGNNLIIDEIHEPTGWGAATDGADGAGRHGSHASVRRLGGP